MAKTPVEFRREVLRGTFTFPRDVNRFFNAATKVMGMDATHVPQSARDFVRNQAQMWANDEANENWFLVAWQSYHDYAAEILNIINHVRINT